MTVEALRDAGVVVDDSEANTWRVEPSEINALDVQVEPDLSNAAPFLAAALVTDGSVRVPGWPQHTTQAGDAIRDIFDAMGAEVSLDRAGLTVTGSGQLSGLDVDLHDVGELTPVVAAVAALADSPSWLRGIAHLRGHETDRLAALARRDQRPRRPRRARPRTGCGSPRRRCTAGCSTPTTTTGWRWRGRSSGCACPAWCSRTSARRPRRCPSSPRRWTRWSRSGDGRRAARRRGRRVTPRRPSLRRERRPRPAEPRVAPDPGPRTGRRTRTPCPASSPAVDRGRYTPARARGRRARGHRDEGARARPQERRRRRRGRAGRRHLRRTGQPGPHRARGAAPDACCAAPPTTPTRSSGSSSPTPTSSSS